MEPEILELLQRGVTALEELAKDPVIHVEAHPPVCPHCEQMNPIVKVRESEAEGKLAQFVIRATCLHCERAFYALPFQMDCVISEEEAKQLIAEREAESGFSNNDGGKG